MQEICQIIDVIFGKKEKSLKLFRPVVRLPGVVHINYVHYYNNQYFLNYSYIFLKISYINFNKSAYTITVIQHNVDI